jgi:magnesium-transporting ATPase (P-type)
VDDNFSSIVAGVEEGRYAYANVRKVVYLLISTGAAEVIMFIPSILLGLPLPLLAVQLLWLNLATNGIQHITLAFEAGEPGTMQKKPRQPNEKMFNPLMVKQTLISASIMGGISFATWFYLIDYAGMAEASARNIVLLLMVFMENFHVFNCRSETTSAFHIPISKNYFLLLGVAGAQGIHVLSMQIPFMQETLRIEPISLTEWLMVLAFGVPIFLGMEVFKYFNRSR